MRKLVLTATLVLALLGVFGVASFYALSSVHSVATHVHQLAGPVCPGGSSAACN